MKKSKLLLLINKLENKTGELEEEINKQKVIKQIIKRSYKTNFKTKLFYDKFLNSRIIINNTYKKVLIESKLSTLEKKLFGYYPNYTFDYVDEYITIENLVKNLKNVDFNTSQYKLKYLENVFDKFDSLIAKEKEFLEFKKQYKED